MKTYSKLHRSGHLKKDSCSQNEPVEIKMKDPGKLNSMPFINGDLRQYETCKGEQLHCAYKIFNKMSSYDQVRFELREHFSF